MGTGATIKTEDVLGISGDEEEELIIELQWAWTPEDLEVEGKHGAAVCGVCGHALVPSGGVVVRAATDGLLDVHGACEECIAYLGSRDPKRSPTLEEYRRIVAEHPRPMFASYEEMKAAAPEHEDPADTFYDASWLWMAKSRGERATAQASPEEDIRVTPTIIHRAYKRSDDEIIHGAATVEKPEKGRALIVFRNPEEAEKYRAATGKHPQEEGFGTASLDLEELGHVLEAHGCTHVAMPEEWTGGEGGVDFFEAADFIRMLEESSPA